MIMRSSWVPEGLATLTFFLSCAQVDGDIHLHDHDQDLSTFFSRPDIRAPKWQVNIKEPHLVSPGYWFVAPFEFIEQHEQGNGWIGPHIYDGNGELVWSGVHLNENWDVIDFKMSNVRGRELLTYNVHREGNGYIMDETFEIKEEVDLGAPRLDFNSHEFYFVEDGSRAISMTDGRMEATEEQANSVDWKGEGPCRALFNGFKVWDTSNWKKIWEWSTSGNVGLNESSYHDGNCGESWGWDFIHLNAVDLDHNGDYYVSARHADTIYKVSRYDGSVIWRLHGRNEPWGDFDMGDVRFSRQHNVRFRGFNGTHEIITLLDNAKADYPDHQKPTFAHSRGLTLALDTQSPNKTARYIMTIDHPDGDGGYAPRRGNYQILSNDNIFIGWSEQALHSEHTPDGQLIMDARLKTQWLGTYRSYKFPFVGRPTEDPVAVSAAYASTARNSTTTLIHVSWNGATEVKHWNFYKTTASGQPTVPIGRKTKTGFETAWAWDGFAAYVLAEAVDQDGQVLGKSNIAVTSEPPASGLVGPAIAEEQHWLQTAEGEKDSAGDKWTEGWSFGGMFVTFVLGAVSGVIVLSVLRATRGGKASTMGEKPSYQPLAGGS